MATRLSRAIAADPAQCGIEMVDAPASGGRSGAAAGTIAIMVGAGPAPFEHTGLVLRAISLNFFHAGGISCGHVLKLAGNRLSNGTRPMALAVKNDVDDAKAHAIMMAGGGCNFWMEKYMADHILPGNLKAASALGLLRKDVCLACRLGQNSPCPCGSASWPTISIRWRSTNTASTRRQRGGVNNGPYRLQPRGADGYGID